MINKAILKDVIEKPITGEWGKEGNTVKVLRTTNFTNDGKIKFDNVVTRDIARNKTSDKRLIKGDIIIEKSGGSPTQPVGRVVFFEAEGEFLCNNFTAILRPKKELVFPKFLFYLLFTYHKYGFTGGFQNKTTGIINLQLKSYIDKTKIPLPPLEAQKKIAEILDAADTLRQKTKTLIEKYDQLTQSMFLDMFGDPATNPKKFEIVKIRDLIVEAKYGTSLKSQVHGEYPYLRMNNITYTGYMNYSDMKYIDIKDSDKQKYNVKKGDIVFNRTNSKDLVGKTGLITNDDEMVIAGYLIRLRTNKFANPYYLWGHLNSKWAKINLKNMCKNIIGMANINAQELQEIKILKAPLPLQNQFAERVQAIEEQKAKAQASLEKSEELFQSLLQRAFKGEIN